MTGVGTDERDGGGSQAEIWQRAAAFLCFGMAVGAPAGQSLAGLRFLPGATVVGYVLALPVLFIGTTALARIVLAPFLDAIDPPGLKRLGRRRGWTALLAGLLVLLAIPIVIMAPAGRPTGAPVAPVALILMAAALAIAGGLMACIDGLRTAQPGERHQGTYAAAQYLGTIIPGGIGAAVLSGSDSLTISAFLCAFVAAAWLGLWLLPGREAPAATPVALPEVKRFLDAQHNLSRSGAALTAWLMGVLVGPIADFFRRHSGLAWAILAVLLLGNLATNLDARQLIGLHTQMLDAGQTRTIGTVHTVGLYAGSIVAAWLVWRLGPARGLAAAFAVSSAAAVAGIISIEASPSMLWFLVALGIDAVADGAVLIALVALIARAASPAFAAFQFSLLWLVALPAGIANALRGGIDAAFGPTITHLVFLVLLTAVIALTMWLAPRLNAAPATHG